MGYRFSFGVLLAASALAALAGCDSAPGPAALDDRPPVVSGLSYSPRLIDLNAAGSPYTIVEGRVIVPFKVQVNASDPDGALAQVVFVVETAYGANRTPLASEPMTASGEDGTYEGSVELSLPVAEPGRYPVAVYAVDADGRLGNQVRGLIDLVNTGSPPGLESVAVTPERLTAPYPEEVVIVATVADPDGLANVAQVEARSNKGTLTLLRDDGGGGFGSGDETLGDGRFSGRFRLEPDFSGPLTFSVHALDRSGLRSATVEKEVVVE